MSQDLVDSAMDKKAPFLLPLVKEGVTSSKPSTISNNANNKTSNKSDAIGWGLNGRRSSSCLSRSGGGGSGLVRDLKVSRNKGQQDPRNKFRGRGCEVTGGGRRNGPEVGSVQTPGGKKRDLVKASLFHFPPRERTTSPAVRGWKHYGQGHRGRHDSDGNGCKMKFSKENYLRANCQFIVKAGKDYEPYIADPDLAVDWDDVEEIVVTMIGEAANCPICLGAPVAAKITKCGHIYCWACMLHYLALSDLSSRPCPICYEPVAGNDLKSVVARIHYDVELQDVIEMELLRRHKDQRFSAPLHSHEATEKWIALYSKILMMSRADVVDKIIDREYGEISQQLAADAECPEACFLHQALQSLQTRKKDLLTEENCTKDPESGNKVSISSSGASSGATDSTGSSASTSATSSPDHDKDSYFFFYQDARGVNIFLHPLNFTMLSKQFGSDMCSWPRYLAMRVIDKEYHTTSEETRKRWKFLRHLPLSASFAIVEVDMTDFVSLEVMVEFATQIDQRKLRREQRAHEEEKLEKIMAERERKMLKIPVMPQFEPKVDFPEFLHDISESFPAPKGFLASESGVTASKTSIDSGIYSTSPENSVASFAKVAGRAPIPAPAPMKKSPSFPLEGPSVTAGNVNSSRQHSESEPEAEEYAAPAFRASIADVITKAMENIVLEGQESMDGAGNKTKKKKNKGKVLFATGMGSFT